ncbi:MAG: hypothetical protein O2819_07275 [Planctomycetota bacterium]|nr:hypothetical protein [Planctomycetota bacterium]MDA1106287.1 hypothetical protein [Planctomycetota bacterium]
MAKQFYTLAEAAQKLGKSTDEVKSLAREHRLGTFFQDGAELFRVQEVDQLADDDLSIDDLELPPDLGAGSGLDTLDDLNLSDLPPLTDAPLNIDEATPSMSSGRAAADIGATDDFALDLGDISLEDSDLGALVSHAPPPPAPAAPMAGLAAFDNDFGIDLADDFAAPAPPTGLPAVEVVPAEDLDAALDVAGADFDFGAIGLAESGSAHGGTAIAGAALDPAPAEMGESPVLSDSSMHFGAVDADDPQLETVGSGSGLMDLTRESEDTSIGAAMLEEDFDAAASGSAGLEGIIGEDIDGAGADFGDAAAPAPVVGGALAGSGMVLAPALDGGWSGLTAGAMLGATLAVVLCLFLSSATLFGGGSLYLDTLQGNLWMVTGIAGGVVGLGMGIGFFVGRATE